MSEEYSSDNESIDEIINEDTFLGFVDVPISEEEQPTIEDTFIGGSPLWLNPQSPPSEELLLCKNCSSPLALLLQTNAHLAGAFYHRVLYVFACKRPTCKRTKGSVRCIRAVCKDPRAMKDWQDSLKNSEKIEKTKFEMPKDLFGGSAGSNPFSSDANPFASSANPFDKKEEAPKIEESKKSYAEAAKQLKPADAAPVAKTKLKIKLPKYPGYILYMDAESLKKKPAPQLPYKIDDSALDTEAEVDTGAGTVTNAAIKQLTDMLDDSQFEKFSSTVAHNPHQVLRYEQNGRPLLYSSGDAVAKLFLDEHGKWRDETLVPRPGFNPSSQRRYELQLMPKAIIDLEAELANINDGMEWGTIIVCTDVEDYVPKLDDNHVGYVEEWCGVQWEEEVKNT